MKKTILVFTVLFSLFSLIAGEIGITPIVSYGIINGDRLFSDDPSSYINLSATGSEGGIVIDYLHTETLRAEAYFDYLFAFKGGEPELKPVQENMRYTDYKAGLGLGFFTTENTRFSFGINFAGISNHKYTPNKPATIENEIEGKKVTSFGLYGEMANHIPILNHFDLILDLHGCLNFIGWIRTLENHVWVNHFDRDSEIKLFSLFFQTGLRYAVKL